MRYEVLNLLAVSLGGGGGEGWGSHGDRSCVKCQWDSWLDPMDAGSIRFLSPAVTAIHFPDVVRGFLFVANTQQYLTGHRGDKK